MAPDGGLVSAEQAGVTDDAPGEAVRRGFEMSNDKINMHDLTLKDGETLLEFPCRFPIKVMGMSSGPLEAAVIEIINRHVDDLGEGAVSSRASKNGKYTAITVTIMAQSKQQLDAIYMDLTACEHVSMAL